MVICLSLLASPGRQSEIGELPKEIFTIVRISSTVTEWSPLQSPAHGFGVSVGGTVCVGVAVMVATGVTVGVLVGVGVGA
jgi:hypothetical protein